MAHEEISVEQFQFSNILIYTRLQNTTFGQNPHQYCLMALDYDQSLSMTQMTLI